MDIRLLRSFIMVADCLSFTEASKRLFLSQSTLSGQIASLEAELGQSLLERDKRSVQLTAAGAVFLQDAYDLILRYEASLRRLKSMGQMLQSLRIAFLSGPFEKLLPRAIQICRACCPALRLELEGRAEEALQKGLLDGSIDLAFTVDWASGLAYMQDGQTMELGRDRFCLLLPAEHPLALRDSAALSQLREDCFILLDRRENPQNYEALVQLCADSGFFPRIYSQVHFLRDIFLLVEAGLGVALVAESLCAGHGGGIRRLALEGKCLESRTVAVWRQKNKNPALPLFLEACRQALAEMNQA